MLCFQKIKIRAVQLSKLELCRFVMFQDLHNCFISLENYENLIFYNAFKFDIFSPPFNRHFMYIRWPPKAKIQPALTLTIKRI